VVSELYEDDMRALHLRNGSTIPAKSDSVKDQHIRILLVEDVSLNMILMKGILKKNMPGAVVFEALNGLQAVEIALREKMDLILMDVQMPEMDGLQATRLIRKEKNSKNRRTPIIAITAGDN